MSHPLGELIAAASQDDFPPADGQVTVLPPVRRGRETVMAFTGHAVVATDLERQDVLARSPDGFGGAVAPRFLIWLAGQDGVIGSHDIVLVATGRGDGTMPTRPGLDTHPRVRHARSLRDGVIAYADHRGLITVGYGIGGLAEVSIEVPPDRRNAGLGRSLATAALGIIAPGQPVVAEVAPGNAQSLRAFLAAGFRPVGSAVHVTPGARA